MGSSRPQTPGLAEKLYDIRAHLGLSQSQLVDRLKGQKLPFPLKLYAGNISRFEKGLREPPPLVLLAYARAVRTSVDVLIDADLELPIIAQSSNVNRKPSITRKAKESAPRKTQRTKQKISVKG